MASKYPGTADQLKQSKRRARDRLPQELRAPQPGPDPAVRPATANQLKQRKFQDKRFGEHISDEPGYSGLRRHRLRQSAALATRSVPRILEDEQTPFGRITFTDSFRSETYQAGLGQTRVVQFVKSEPQDFPGCSTASKFESYHELAEHITPRVARMILIELLETVIAGTGETPETDSQRSTRTQKRQAIYQNEDATTRRVMAMVYGLILSAEEQRTFGGKKMRGALFAIVAKRISAEEAFVGSFTAEGRKAVFGGDTKLLKYLKKHWDELYDIPPIITQTGKGGVEMHRAEEGGASRPSERQRQMEDEFMSVSSDVEGADELRLDQLEKLIAEHNAAEEKQRKFHPTIIRSEVLARNEEDRGALEPMLIDDGEEQEEERKEEAEEQEEEEEEGEESAHEDDKGLKRRTGRVLAGRGSESPESIASRLMARKRKTAPHDMEELEEERSSKPKKARTELH